MESVRRSLRVVKSQPGTEPVAESTPAIEQKKARQLSARKALEDVTNTCDIKSDRPSRTRVARKQVDVDELGNQSALKPEIDPKLSSNAKSKRKVIGTRIVASSSSSLAEDSTTKGVRVRKTKEQANVVGSRVDSTPIPVATPKDPVVKAARGRKVKEHILGSKAPSVPTSVEVSGTTSVVAPPKDPVVKVVRGRKAKEQVQLESKFGIAHVGDATSIVGIPQGVATGKQTSSGPKSKRKVVQVESISKVIIDDTDAIKEKVPCNQQTGSSLQQQQRVRASRSSKGSAEKSTCAGEAHSLRPKRTIRLKKGVVGDETSPTNIAESIKRIPLKVPKENQDDVNASSTNEGLVTPSQMGVMRRATHQSGQNRMKASQGKPTRRKAIKDAQLQTSGAKNDVAVVCEATHVHVEKPLLHQRSKKGTGTQTGNKKGASREAVCLSNSTENKCTGGLRSCADSGHERSTGVLKDLPTESLKNAPVQPACRRNAARGARKPINYAEDDNLATSKTSSFLKGTPIMHGDQTATKGGAPNVQQTMRKGRHKVAGADNTSIPSCIENPPSKDLVDGVISMTATTLNSLEQGDGQFKLGNLAPDNVSKKPPLAATTKLVEPMSQTSTKSVDSVFGELSVQTMGVTEHKEEAQTPARKFIRAIRSSKDKVGASPNLHSAQASEQVPHVTEPSLSRDPGAELPFLSTTVQRGLKRGRKEDNVKATGEPVRLLTDADVDAKPSCTSSPHVFVNVITVSDELDEDNREFNGAHEHDEQVDTSKVDGMAKDDPDWAVYEHEDQVCVNVSGKECNTSLLKPLASFDDADILKKLKDCCKALEKPSPLQAHALPVLLAGRALVAISESDAGHVHAYGAPVLQYVMKKKKSYVRKRPSPLCLVLAASSELAREITDSLQETYGSLRVKIAHAVVDSANVPMMETVKPGVAILVTTPNCLQKMLGDGSCSLALASFIVLDGADCMLNNGHEASLRVIFNEAPPCEQIGVFSSTWESGVEQLVQTFIPNLEIVKIIVHKSVDMQEQLPEEEQVVHQIVEVLEESNKDTRLTALLRTFQKGKKNRVLVYVLYKEEALHVEGLLQQRGWKVASVHGGIFEADRNKAVVSFQKGASSVLVATDVAARGLIIPNVDYVINYSFPYTLDDYARRLRQTGRTGKRGIMHTFFLPANQARAKELVEVLRAAGQDVPEELLHFTSPAKKKPRTEH